MSAVLAAGVYVDTSALRAQSTVGYKATHYAVVLGRAGLFRFVPEDTTPDDGWNVIAAEDVGGTWIRSNEPDYGPAPPFYTHDTGGAPAAQAYPGASITVPVGATLELHVKLATTIVADDGTMLTTTCYGTEFGYWNPAGTPINVLLIGDGGFGSGTGAPAGNYSLVPNGNMLSVVVTGFHVLPWAPNDTVTVQGLRSKGGVIYYTFNGGVTGSGGPPGVDGTVTDWRVASATPNLTTKWTLLRFEPRMATLP